jgi:Phytanoyl-CoA dioxygenase (PhyH)
VVSDDKIAAVLKGLEEVYSGRMPRYMSYWDQYGHHLEPAVREHMGELEAKLIDYHWTSQAAQDLIFAPKVRRFLELVFQQIPLAFQSLYFHRGSQQGIHQDTAFVPVADAPLEFVASWIALEDVEPGSGELLYVRKSHRLRDLTFTAGNKKCPPDDPLLPEYNSIVRRAYESAGLAPQAFLPKKGDALLWAADLAHGGAPITREDSTRRAMVTHYCPLSRRPEYVMRGGDFEVRETRAGGYVTSQG